MADVRISELPSAPTVVDADLTVVVHQGVTMRATVGQIQGSVLLDQSFVTVVSESGLPTSRQLVASGGLTLTDGGPLSTFSLQTVGLLNSLSSLGASTGILASNAGTAVTRTITGGASISVTNGNGATGDPTLDLTNTGVTPGGYTYANISVDVKGRVTGASSNPTPVTSFNAVQPAEGLTVSGSPINSGSTTLTFTLANDLAAVEGLTTTGFATRTATDTWATRTLTQPAAGITITNPAGLAGNPTFALANDLAAVEGLATTGFSTRTATDTWTTRTITGTANEITATNGDGIAGNPTLSLPTALTFTGKTITGGTFSSPTITTPTMTIRDNAWTMQDDVDNTKQFQFQASGITTGTTRTLTVPNQTDTLATVSDAIAFGIALG